MKTKLITFVLLLACLISAYSYAKSQIPKALEAKVNTLISVISDGAATGYSKSISVQTLSGKFNQEITLVLFTIEGFGGGNNWSQYLAAFDSEYTVDDQKFDYALNDFIRIGGKGWRSIPNLNAKLLPQKNHQTLLLSIPAMENSEDDGPNFPSKKTQVILEFKNHRFYER